MKAWGAKRALQTDIVGRHFIGAIRLVAGDTLDEVRGTVQYLTFRDTNEPTTQPASVGEFREIYRRVDGEWRYARREIVPSVRRRGPRRRTPRASRIARRRRSEGRGGRRSAARAVPSVARVVLRARVGPCRRLRRRRSSTCSTASWASMRRAASCARSLAPTRTRMPASDRSMQGPILRLLDSGARGIIAPTVESRDQAEALVAATKYLPVGNRSMGPSRPALYAGDSYAEAGNQRRVDHRPDRDPARAWSTPRRSSPPRAWTPSTSDPPTSPSRTAFPAAATGRTARFETRSSICASSRQLTA